MLVGSFLACALGACTVRNAPRSLATASIQESTPDQSTRTPPTRTPSPSAAAVVFATSMPTVSETARSPHADVRVIALGNVYIRRGPNTAFNPISVLTKGRSAVATGRDVLSKWLRIRVPDAASDSDSGWISIMTDFTQVEGAVDSLPELDPQDWPELASLRNCTLHEMRVEPVGLTLPPVYDFPFNDVRIDPGMYSIIDVDLDGYPGVLQVEIREGMSIDVIVDGSGEKKKCPPP